MILKQDIVSYKDIYDIDLIIFVKNVYDICLKVWNCVLDYLKYRSGLTWKKLCGLDLKLTQSISFLDLNYIIILLKKTLIHVKKINLIHDIC